MRRSIYLTYRLYNEVVNYVERSAQRRLRRACRSHAARDSDTVDGGRCDGWAACRAVSRLAACDLTAPEGARRGGADLASSPRHRALQPPRGRVVTRRDHVAGWLPRVLGGEPRPARHTPQRGAGATE